MSVISERLQRPPAAELGFRSGPTFSAGDLARSTSTIDDLVLVPDRLAATGTGGVIIAAQNDERDDLVVKVGFGTDPIALKRAKKEAKIATAAAAVTDNVSAVLDTKVVHLDITTEVDGDQFTVSGKFPVTVSEHIEGEILAAKIPEGGLGVAETVRVLRPVAEALDEIHRAGITHRDATPRNVIDSPEKGGVLIDFDNAFEGIVIADQNNIEGTPGYMAPEEFQLEGQITSAVDRWVLAATAFNSMTGERLVPGKTIIATMVAMADREGYNALMQTQLDHPNLGPSVRAVMEHALAYEPEARFASAKHFIASLNRADQKDQSEKTEQRDSRKNWKFPFSGVLFRRT